MGYTYYYELKDENRARKIFAEALAIPGSENSGSIVEVYIQLANLEMKDKNWEKALEYLDPYIESREKLFEINMTVNNVYKYEEEQLDAFYSKIECLVALYKKTGDKKYWIMASGVSYSIKGRSFLVEAATGKSFSDTIFRSTNLKQFTDSIYFTYISSSSKDRHEKLVSFLNDYERTKENIAQLHISDELRASNRDDKSILDYPDNSVDFILNSKESYAWVKSGDSIYSYFLPSREYFDTITQRINSYIELLQYIRGIAKKAKILNIIRSNIGNLSMQIKPILKQLKPGKVYIVRDGPLTLIPFQLLDIGSDTVYRPALIYFDFCYLPSFRFYFVQKQKEPLTVGNMLMVADPVFDRTDVRLKGKNLQIVPVDMDYSRLEGSQAEARKINRYFDKCEILPGFDANRDQFTSMPLSKYDYIHFATHSVYDYQLPEMSNLILSHYDSTGRSTIPHLFAFEIQNLNLNANLVVLGSCYSGAGKAYTTEGVLSLERAFLVAGASSVISANWALSDRFSSDFFSTFYSYHRGDGLTPSEALRRTQLDFLKTDNYSSFIYWGAFVYTGID